MTDNHKELCERLDEAISIHGPNCSFLKELRACIDFQAARIQQQALEYVSLFDQCSQHLARIAELEKERDALIHDNAQLVKAASAEATLASEALAERDALKEDAERWRIIESTLPTDELQDIAIIVAAEHSVNVANGFSKAPADLLDAAVAALQAEKETKS